MELCHTSNEQLASQFTNSSDRIELVAQDCGVCHLQPYHIYGWHCVLGMTISVPQRRNSLTRNGESANGHNR